MDVSVVKSHIQTGKFNRYYIFTGPEVVVRSAYIEQIAKVRKAPIKTFDTFIELSKFARTVSLLSDASIYVVTDDTQIISDDKLQSVLRDDRAFRNDTIILVFNNIDKRNKFYKNFKDEIVEFEYLPESTLVNYIKKQLALSNRNCQSLIDACDRNYSAILLELDKVKHYMAMHGNLSADDAFDKLVQSNTLYVPPRDAIFDFIDAVLTRKIKKAYALLDECYASGEFTLNILSNLFNNARYVLQVQTYSGSNKLTDVTGLTPFQVKLACGRKNTYSPDKLIELMKLSQSAELGIKTGKIDDEVAVEYVLARFWT